MRELTPGTITDAVVDRMATTPDPRLKPIMKQSRTSEPAPAGRPVRFVLTGFSSTAGRRSGGTRITMETTHKGTQ